jgi:hypothetical protein
MLLLLILSVSTVFASFMNCDSSLKKEGLPLTALVAEPLHKVTGSQPCYFTINFTVPSGTFIPHGIVEVTTRWNGLNAHNSLSDLSDYIQLPLRSGNYTFRTIRTFPIGIWGYVNTDIVVYNSSGAQLLCARWSVYAS